MCVWGETGLGKAVHCAGGVCLIQSGNRDILMVLLAPQLFCFVLLLLWNHHDLELLFQALDLPNMRCLGNLLLESISKT